MRVTVTNTGERAGDEVVQLYVHDVAASIAQPVRRLRGFERVTLERARAATVTFELGEEDLGFWTNDPAGTFLVERGRFDVYAGTSSTARRGRRCASCSRARDRSRSWPWMTLWTGAGGRGTGALLLLLPAHDLGDPDTGANGDVQPGESDGQLEHFQALADVDGPGAVLGVVDADLRQAVVHRPLEAVRGVHHLRLDDVEQPREVEPCGFFATRSVVSARPALATTGSGSAVQATRRSSACRLFFTT